MVVIVEILDSYLWLIFVAQTGNDNLIIRMQHMFTKLMVVAWLLDDWMTVDYSDARNKFRRNRIGLVVLFCIFNSVTLAENTHYISLIVWDYGKNVQIA